MPEWIRDLTPFGDDLRARHPGWAWMSFSCTWGAAGFAAYVLHVTP